MMPVCLRRAAIGASVAAAIVAASPSLACAFDGMPGYSHYAVDGADPYAGAYAEAAARIAEQRRQEAIETARLAMLKRLGRTEADETAVAAATPASGAVQIAANAQP